MAFDYDNVPDVSADVIAEISAEIAGTGLPPLSEEEREWQRIEHERFVATCRERDRQQRLEYEHRQAELAEAKQAEARQAAIARAERTHKLQSEEQSRRQKRDRTLTGLLDHAVRQEQFRHSALRSAAHASARQRLKSVLYPPEPPPEPAVIVVSEDDGSADFGSRNFDVAKWAKKPRSWW